MPPPIPVRLTSHDPAWAVRAEAEASRLRQAIGDVSEIHHIGSAAIPGIVAKPIIDLLVVAPSLAALDTARPRLEALGYAWLGEYGLAGRRYCTLSDRDTGARIVQLHAYARGDRSIDRHLAFRDHLRARPDAAAAYACEKQRCAALHPQDSHAYTDCKSDWIRRVEAQALKERPERGS